MKKFKRIMALVIALAMVLAMTTAVFAEDQSWENDSTDYSGDTHSDTTFRVPAAADGSISVSGLSNGDTVKFFKVLAYDQDAYHTIENAAAMTTNGTDWGAMSWKLISPFTTGSGDGQITLQDFKDLLTTGISSTLAGKLAKLVDDTPDYEATATTEVTSGSGNYKAEVVSNQTTTVDPGLYVAIVEPANAGFIYNPIFVANDYYKTGDGSVSNTWAVVENALSYSNEALAKKEPVKVTKTDVEPEASEPTNEQGYVTTAGENSGKSVGKGDTVNFTITTTIPAFASNYENPIFIVSDVMTSGLALIEGTVKVYPATVDTDTGVYTKGETPMGETSGNVKTFVITYPAAAQGAAETDPDYKVTFDPEYIKGLTTPQPIVIEYSATVTEDAIENVHAEDNTVSVEYSHKPDVDQEGEGKKVKDKTHHYSYTIDGNIWGSSEFKSYEVVKVGLDKDGNEIEQTTELDNGNEIGALAGAEFKLYTNEGCTAEYNKGVYADAVPTDDGNKIISDAGGRLTITIVNDEEEKVQVGIPGLDAGTYWLKEEKAPEGYIKQQAPTKIEIIPTYYPEITWTETEGTGEDAYTYTVTCDDLLKSYIVKVDDVQVAEYTLNYKNMNQEGTLPLNDEIEENAQNMKTTDGDIVISNNGPVTTNEEKETTNTEGKILNTQGTELPSTGGIGTTIFYMVGAILVIGAGVILITRRRMDA